MMQYWTKTNNYKNEYDQKNLKKSKILLSIDGYVYVDKISKFKKPSMAYNVR